MNRILIVSALLTAAMAGAASAQTLDIDVVHGNETGCAVEGGADYVTDDKIILRPSGIEAHESFCEFVQVLPARSGARVTTSLCQSEGAYEIRMHTISEPDPESGTRVLFFSDGAFWTEVGPCS